MKTSPKISIIIPTYNRETIIGRTLDCIASQTFTEWECIVVDDFSTDNTNRLIEEFEEKDSRFHYMLNERRKGAQGARNTGIYHACSEWIWLMDSDDTVHEDFLEKMYGAINEDVDVVTCYTNVVDKDSMRITNTRKWNCVGNIHESLLAWKCYVYYPSSIVRKSKLYEIGGLDEFCPAHQEYDMHIILSKTACYTTVPEALFDYYVGGDDTISVNHARIVEGRIYLLRKHKSEWLKYRDAGIKLYDMLWTSITWSYTSRWRKLWAYMRSFIASPKLYFAWNRSKK